MGGWFFWCYQRHLWRRWFCFVLSVGIFTMGARRSQGNLMLNNVNVN
jgi:hypothetical protein